MREASKKQICGKKSENGNSNGARQNLKAVVYKRNLNGRDRLFDRNILFVLASTRLRSLRRARHDIFINANNELELAYA